MNWLKTRLTEATSHVSLAVVLQAAALVLPQYTTYFTAAALVFGAAGFVVPEKGQPPR